MPHINNQETIFIDLESQLDTSWPDGIMVFCKDTNNTWVLDNGVFVPVGGTNIFIQNGINTFTGGTTSFPTINVTAATLNNLNVSGSSLLSTTTATSFSGGTVSGGTLYSGSTNLYNIFLQTSYSASTAGGSNINGLNTYTGGSISAQTINVSAATLDNLTVSGNSILAQTTGTTLSLLNSGATTSIWNDYSLNRINTGVSFSNIVGGTGNTVNANLSNVNIIGGYRISGTNDNHTYTSNLVVTGTSNGNLYATKIYSGSTEISLLFNGSGDYTRVQPGTNIYTGGTDNYPTVNVSALTINTLTASGASTFTSTLSASTLSAATMISGSTNLYNIFATSTGFTPETIYVAISDETTQITTGTNKVTIYAPYAFTLSDVKVSLAQSGSAISTFNVKLTGTTIFSTKPTIDANEFTTATAATPRVITATTIPVDSKITFDVDGIGTGCAGAKVYLMGYRI